VLAAWQRTVPVEAAGGRPQPALAPGQLHVERAGPRQADEIADFISRLSKGKRPLKRADIMESFGEKAYLVLKRTEQIVGLAGWQVENLIARTADVYLEPGLSLEEAMRVLLAEVESASRELQSEASLLFLPPELARHESVWQALHYEPRTAENLDVRAWQEAARESMPAGTVLLFKPLRKDRVLRPV
jgi:dephospho-CoA kinase